MASVNAFEAGVNDRLCHKLFVRTIKSVSIYKGALFHVTQIFSRMCDFYTFRMSDGVYTTTATSVATTTVSANLLPYMGTMCDYKWRKLRREPELPGTI